MVPRSHKIGWCLVLASSLIGFGCNHLPPKNVDKPMPQEAPEMAPPLNIPNPPSGPAPTPKLIADNSSPAALGSAEIRVPVAANAATPATASPPETIATVTPPSMRAVLADPKTDVKNASSPNASSPPAQTALRPLVDSPMRALYRLAANRFDETPGYSALFKRREMVEGKERPEEVIIFKFRKDPASIYMRWTGTEAKNRELVYVKGQHDDMLHVAPGSNDSLFAGSAGHQVLLRPDTARGLGKERYAVAETGVGALIERFGRLVDAFERGARVGSLKYLETVQRPESDVPLETVLHVIPSGVDPTLPQGGQRLWFFDPKLHFPVLVIAHDNQGKEAEYYFFDRFMFPGRIQDEQFSPSALGHR